MDALDNSEINGLLDAMAQYMADVLSIKDPECAPKHTFLHVQYNEGNYTPSLRRWSRLKETQQRQQFAIESDRLASEMAYTAERILQQDENIVVTQWSTRGPYSFYTDHVHKRTRKVTRVGGIGIRLRDELHERVTKWLKQVDKCMCLHFEDGETGAAESSSQSDIFYTGLLDASEAELDRLVKGLSLSIARRLTCTEPPGSVFEEADALSAKMLQARASMEVQRSAMKAERRAQQDLSALRTLLVLCKPGQTSDVISQLLSSKMNELRHITTTPPVELGLTGKNADRMNLTFLRRVCEADLCQTIQLRIVAHWSKCHGGFAQTAISQAISKLEGFKTPTSGFQSVIRRMLHNDTSTECPPRMPEMSFVRGGRKFRFLSPNSEEALKFKRGLPHVLSRRMVRLTSLVWELLAHGALERGVVEPTMVHSVATFNTLCARRIIQREHEVRERNSIGVRVKAIEGNLRDLSSMASDEVRRASCHLSKFSLAQIMAVFEKTSELLPVVCREFARRTHDKLVFKPPADYTEFAADGLAYAVPLIEILRNQLWTQPSYKPNPLGDMLRTIPKVRDWMPQRDGVLRLAAKDLQKALPAMPKILKDLSKKRQLVRYYRPMLPDGRQFSTNIYEFDSCALAQLYRS